MSTASDRNSSSPAPAPEYLTTEQLVERLHYNPKTIQRYAKAGKLPGVRIGRKWQFSVADIERKLRESQQAEVQPV